MDTNELRRILKVFGVSATDFAEEASRIRQRVQGLSKASPEEVAGLLRDLCELLLDVEEKSGEVGRALDSAKRELLSTLAQAAGARAGARK